MATKGWTLKDTITKYGCIGVAVVVELACIALIVYLLHWLAIDVWKFFIEPGLSKRLAELAASLGYLGLCCVGIIVSVIIIGNIPRKWLYPGSESSSNDDDDPYYRYM